MVLPQLSEGASRGTVRPMAANAVSSVGASGLLDWLCKWFDLPWCDAPEEPCYYDRTDTKCWGVVLMCKDRGYTPSGRACSSGWYACGGCIGFPW